MTQQGVPVKPWEVLTGHSALDACEEVGLRAVYYGLNAIAARALRRVAEAGGTEAMAPLAMTYLDENDLGNANRWFLAAAEAGDAMAMAMLAVVLQEQGDTAGAREWVQRGAEAGNTGAMIGYGSELEKDDDPTAARSWYKKSTETGDEGQGMLFLGCLLRTRATWPPPSTASWRLSNRHARSWRTTCAPCGYRLARSAGHVPPRLMNGAASDASRPGTAGRGRARRADRTGQSTRLLIEVSNPFRLDFEV